METFAIYGYTVSTCAYLILLCFSLIQINKNPLAVPIVVTLLLSVIWSGYTVFVLQNEVFYIQDTFPLESLRNLAWFFLLRVLISKQQFNSQYYLLHNTWRTPVVFFVIIIIALLEGVSQLRYQVQEIIGFDFRLFAHIGFALIGLMMVEQLYRNAMPDQRWGNKFICLGLASLFVFDFILYSKSLLFSVLDMSLWGARGFIQAFIVLLLAISLSRLGKEVKGNVVLKVSNQVIFHTTVLLGAGVYLLLMSLAGYYIKYYGGNWGAIAQISFIFLAIILLLVFFVSGKIRALAKVYFSKHFHQQRHNYRDEWIKLSKKIAKLHSLDDLSRFIVSTMAKFVDSSGGGIWIKNDEGDFYLAAEQSLGDHNRQVISNKDLLVSFLQSKQWVIDFVEFINDPEIYEGSGLEQWYTEHNDIWLIVPLFQDNKLVAFVVLTKPRVYRQIDWEDHDLLKTVGMQLANALALKQTSDNLSRARQFEAYNQFSAFLVHDLKNLVAQVSLIVKNSEKHKRNPEFIDDSIDTLVHVVAKIEKILGQLKKGNIHSNNQQKINLIDVLEQVVVQQSANRPVLNFKVEDEDCWILAEKEKMVAILGHLVQNAQEATDDNGFVEIKLLKQQNEVILKVMDNGCGMDENFIQQRLFKPFDTTKGNAGMGIGVYETREYILRQGGSIMVESELKKGTTFILTLPQAS